MKRTILDQVVGFFSPDAEIRRFKTKAKREFLQRSYDAAQTFQTDDWTSANTSGSNTENKTAIETLRNKGRDAIRNNPYALHAKNVIVSNGVGAGIVPNIKGPDATQVELAKAAWKTWAETSLCDLEGRMNYSQLQALTLGATAESGESIAKKVLVREPVIINSKAGEKKVNAVFKIQILESDFIDTKKEDSKTVQGVEIDLNGKRTGYWIFASHPGEGKESKSARMDSAFIAHTFMQGRPGQLRGVTWFHSVIRILEDLKEYSQASLIRQKIAACYAAFITHDESDMMLSVDDRNAKYLAESTLEPGLIKHLGKGENITFANPPSVENYSEYVRQNLRAVSAGLSITYEALSNDYSQVNFSSGRMGHLEMFRNVDMWRWNMLIPQFCEPTFKWFLEWCELVGINTAGIYAEWTPPARQMIDPGSETEAIKKQIRTGILTLPEAIRAQGYDPETFFNEVADSNKKMDDLGLAFDSDARKMSSVGFAQAGDSFDKLTGQEPVKDTTSETKP